MPTRFIVLLAAGVVALSAPASGQTAATICKDGSTSAAAGRGACADHGGIDKGRTKAAKKAVKAEAKEVVGEAKKAGAMVTCGDGSSSNPGRGACSRHGGVKIGPTAAPTTTMSVPAPAPAPAPRPVPATRASRATPATPATPASPSSASSHRGEDSDPSGAIAQCKDGMYSHASNRRGACSRHKGVAKWM